jgi:hypothetical protein
MGYLRDGEDLDQAFIRAKREAIGAAKAEIVATAALIPPTVPGELVFEAYVVQTGGSTPLALTSGSLTIGMSYIIDSIAGSDDFTNVGALTNDNNVRFIATGTTPNVWTGESSISYDSASPICKYILKNTIGCTGVMYGLKGIYRLHFPSNLISMDKVFVEVGSLQSGNGNIVDWQYGNTEYIDIHTFKNGDHEDDTLNSRIKVVLLP